MPGWPGPVTRAGPARDRQFRLSPSPPRPFKLPPPPRAGRAGRPLLVTLSEADSVTRTPNHGHGVPSEGTPSESSCFTGMPGRPGLSEPDGPSDSESGMPVTLTCLRLGRSDRHVTVTVFTVTDCAAQPEARQIQVH